MRLNWDASTKPIVGGKWAEVKTLQRTATLLYNTRFISATSWLSVAALFLVMHSLDDVIAICCIDSVAIIVAQFLFSIFKNLPNLQLWLSVSEVFAFDSLKAFCLLCNDAWLSLADWYGSYSKWCTKHVYNAL